MNWQIYLADHAEKQIRKLPKSDAGRIKNVIDEIEINPFRGDIEKLIGAGNIWRRRVGSYRLIYEILVEKKLIYIFDIKRRTSTTY